MDDTTLIPFEGGQRIGPYRIEAPLGRGGMGVYRAFMLHRNALVFLKATMDIRKRNFYLMDLDNRQERQLTEFKPGFLMQSFDVSPDGKQIVFDRIRENSDIVLINLATR